MAGFFKVPHELYRALSRDSNTFRVYCEIASRARWSAGACLGSHGIVELAIGQCVLGRAEIAAELDLTERAVRTALDRLSKLRVVTIESTKRGTVATIHEQWTTAEATPSERPTLDTGNDQASTIATAIRPPSKEEPRREEEKKEDRRERSRRKPATPLPDTWNPQVDDNKLSGKQLENELASFRDYAKANDWRKADWDATWRNWQRKADAYANGRKSPRASNTFGSAPPATAHSDESKPFGAVR